MGDSLGYTDKQNSMIKELWEESALLKKQLIESQATVITLQNDLIESKDKQLQLVQTAVKSSVAETVKAEFVTYKYSAQDRKVVKYRSWLHLNRLDE